MHNVAMMNPKLKILILIASATIGAWTIYEIISLGFSAPRIALLLYVAFIGVALLTAPIKAGSEAVLNQSATNSGSTKRDVEAIVLNIIRQAGKAQRHDLLPQLGMSRSSLGRLLDQMEAKGVIRQEGDRKASYYVLTKKEG